MLSMVVHSTNAKECALMEKLLKDLIAFYSEEELNIHLCSTLADLEQCVEKIDVLDLICLDIVQEGAVAAAERLRQRHKMAMMILVVDQSLSPINYIRPTILAAALLLRPVHPELARETLKEVLRNLRSNRIPIRRILFFRLLGRLIISHIVRFSILNPKIKRYFCALRIESMAFMRLWSIYRIFCRRAFCAVIKAILLIQLSLVD